MNELLPLGSIVELNNKKIYMIIGYNPNKPNDDELHDYIVCSSKLGIIKKKDDLHLNKDFFYIDKKDIEKVLFIGYSDSQFEKFDYCSFIVNSNVNIAKSRKKLLSQEEIEDLYLRSYIEIKGSGIK